MTEGAISSLSFYREFSFSEMTVAIPNRALSSGIGTLQYAPEKCLSPRGLTNKCPYHHSYDMDFLQKLIMEHDNTKL